MRILFISNLKDHWSGSESLWAETGRSLAANGHPVGFYLPRPISHPALDALRAAGATAHIAKNPTWWRRTRNSGDARTRMLAGFKPDFVAASLNNFREGVEWMPSLRALHAPYALITHAVTQTDHLSDDALDRLGELYANARATFFSASRSREILEHYLGRRLPQSRIVRNPVRVPYDEPFRWPTESGLHLAMVSRLQPDQMGHDVLFEVLGRPHWRQRPVWLHLFGEGENERRLRRLQAMLALDRVVFEGPASEVAAVWRHCHVVAMPSREDSPPDTMIEGMLMGRPVVGTALGGIPEIAEDGISGILAPSADRELLDAAMEQLWVHRAHLPEMGQAAQIRARAMIPSDPISVFANELLGIANAA